MTFFVGFWLTESAVIRASSHFSNSSVKMKQYRHKQTYNYKLSAILALFWKTSNDLQKINDLVGYEMQCFFTSWNSPKCHSEKILIAKSTKTWN